jgi:NAD+ diphosphatase
MSDPVNASAACARPSLQRRSEQRRPADHWLHQARSDPQTRVVVARGTAQLIRYQPQTQIVFASMAQPVIAALDASRLLLLGWFEGQRCVLADLPPEVSFELPGTRFEELRPLLAQLRYEEARLLCYARALLVWRSRHRYCGICGAPTAPGSAGHLLVCTAPSCAAEVFPRIDPAIIVLVTSGSKALLGRQKSWPAGRYSALAGFVEPGETLEEAVAREVEEETGVQLESVRYFASQPWPFPASLMLGFHAEAPQSANAPQTPVRLDGELEDARWFDRAELQSASGPLLPQPHTIARRLIDHWLAADAAQRSGPGPNPGAARSSG